MLFVQLLNLSVMTLVLLLQFLDDNSLRFYLSLEIFICLLHQENFFLFLLLLFQKLILSSLLLLKLFLHVTILFSSFFFLHLQSLASSDKLSFQLSQILLKVPLVCQLFIKGIFVSLQLISNTFLGFLLLVKLLQHLFLFIFLRL